LGRASLITPYYQVIIMPSEREGILGYVGLCWW
jgi:hypothetical protein